MKKSYWIGIGIIIVLLLAGKALVWYTHRPVPPAQGGAQTVAMVSIATTTAYMTITGSYPQYADASSDFNASIAQLVNKLISESEIDSQDNWRARVDTDSSSSTPTTPDQDERMSFDIVPTTVRDDASIISLKLDVSSYTGGAHGSHTIFSFNYDKHAGSAITIDTLSSGNSSFLAGLSHIVRPILLAQLAREASTTEDQVDTDMLDSGIVPQSDNFSTFTMPDDRHITFYFQEYQVAAYVFGTQEVTIDWPVK